MGHIRVIAAFAAGLLALSLAAPPAAACGCQKEYMIKKYGSLNGLGGAIPTATTPAPPAAPAPAPVQAPGANG
jgi:hypothetical protein